MPKERGKRPVVAHGVRELVSRFCTAAETRWPVAQADQRESRLQLGFESVLEYDTVRLRLDSDADLRAAH